MHTMCEGVIEIDATHMTKLYMKWIESRKKIFAQMKQISQHQQQSNHKHKKFQYFELFVSIYWFVMIQLHFSFISFLHFKFIKKKFLFVHNNLCSCVVLFIFISLIYIYFVFSYYAHCIEMNLFVCVCVYVEKCIESIITRCEKCKIVYSDENRTTIESLVCIWSHDQWSAYKFDAMSVKFKQCNRKNILMFLIRIFLTILRHIQW